MKSLVYVLAFLVGWELYEIFFRPDVKESLLNRIIDFIVGMSGALISQLVFLTFLA
jgi:hypothetical protein